MPLDQTYNVAGGPVWAEPLAERGRDHPQAQPTLASHSL
jgi:hypothetical protein